MFVCLLHTITGKAAVNVKRKFTFGGRVGSSVSTCKIPLFDLNVVQYKTASFIIIHLTIHLFCLVFYIPKSFVSQSKGRRERQTEFLSHIVCSSQNL